MYSVLRPVTPASRSTVEQVLGDLVVGARQRLAGRRIDHVESRPRDQQEIVRYRHGLARRLIDLADVLGG